MEGATELAERVAAEWNQTIPAPPDGFPEEMAETFTMPYAEASWLRERIVNGAPGTLLAHLPHADVDPLVISRGWTPHLTVAYAVDEPEHRAAALELVRAALPLTGTWRTLETWQLDERPTRQLTQRDLSR